MSGADRLRTGRPAIPWSERTLQLAAPAQANSVGRGNVPKTAVNPAHLEAPAVTQPQWERLLAMVAVGTTSPDAVTALGIDPIALEGMLRADPAKYRMWREAQIAAERRAWSVEVVEGIIDKVSNGTHLRPACQAHGKDAVAFMRLLRRDPTLKAMYEEARELAAELEQDHLKEISDDDGNDMTLDGKGNMAAVSRADLRIKTRLRLMGANSKKFQDQRGQKDAVNVQVNINHAERLEKARARVRQASIAPPGEVVDAEVVEVTTDGDLSWAN